MSRSFTFSLIVGIAVATLAPPCHADESLEKRARELGPRAVAAQARMRGDPRHGALVFFKSAMACAKCHASNGDGSPLGPDLTTIDRNWTDAQIVEAILDPSKSIRKGFETVTVATEDGQVVTGLCVKETNEQIVLREVANLESEITIPRDTIDQHSIGKESIMPKGLVASLQDEHELYSLVRYVLEVARGGRERAAQLQPRPEDLIVIDDTQDLDHAGILESLGEEDLKAGRRIYQGHCANCHGQEGNTPKLPTARAFGRQPLKYGADPYRMLQTLTRGAGLMTPMQHLSPRERYQVVYYIREELMQPNNPAYEPVDDAYLSSLPEGTADGELAEAGDRDFGPVVGSQVGSQVNNALTFRLPDDVTFSYDLHRMRSAGVWTDGFLDLSQTQHYRQRGERMPQIDGDLIPGLTDWQWALGGSFDIPEAAKPPRGPVRPDWLQFYGHYLHGDRAILSYGIHDRRILETVTAQRDRVIVQLQHLLHVGAGEQPLQLCVAKLKTGRGPSGLFPVNSAESHGLSGPAADRIALISGAPDENDARPRMTNDPWHVVDGKKAQRLDLGIPQRTLLVRFRTRGSGTIVASAPLKGKWRPNGKTLFVRGGRLVYDIGWVGALTSRSTVNDGQCHTAALVVTDDETLMYIDGRLEGRREDFRRPPEKSHVLKIGATATDFGGDYVGDIDWVRLCDEVLDEDEIAEIVHNDAVEKKNTLFEWLPGSDEDSRTTQLDRPNLVVAGASVSGDAEGLTWSIDEEGRIVLTIPPSDRSRRLEITRCSGTNVSPQAIRSRLESINAEPADPAALTRGGPTRWPELLTVEGVLGEPLNGYALDTIPVPFDNPWNAWLRTSALDFFDDGRAVVTTHGGDVYLVSGLDENLDHVTWKRFAAGLFEPFGVRIVDGLIYVTCRDGLKRLHDYDGNGEADFVEAFWIDDDVSSMFHAYNFDLQTDSHGNFYFAKAGQYTRHHRPGTIMRIPPEGGRADVVAWGLRTPNGMGKLFDDRFTVSDNQGPWMPAGKISLIRPGDFLGNMPINDEQEAWLKQRHGGELPETFDEPIIWTPQELDNSCGGQVWVEDERFGPLSGRLIHSSFGKGWLYYLSLQEVDGKTQASIVALPHQWDAGVMRLRVNPHDGQLYGTGLSGWQGPRNGQDGCLQRLRYTGEPTRMIDTVRVVPDGLEVAFNFEVAPATVTNPQSWQGEMWDYLWSKRYGSDQFSVLRPGEQGRDPLRVEQVDLIDSRTVRLHLPDLTVCDQVSLQMQFEDATGELFLEHIYLTVHAIPEK